MFCRKNLKRTFLELMTLFQLKKNFLHYNYALKMHLKYFTILVQMQFLRTEIQKPIKRTATFLTVLTARVFKTRLFNKMEGNVEVGTLSLLCPPKGRKPRLACV